MYYSYPCPYCSKIFYTFNDSKDQAAKVLYTGIKQHLTDYGEDEKEHQLDDGPSLDTSEIYSALTESNESPSGGYQIG